MSDYTVEEGTPVIIFKRGSNTLERRELKRDAQLDRSQIEYHGFVQGEYLMLVPANALNMRRIPFPPPENQV